jgi:hypothetical protein
MIKSQDQTNLFEIQLFLLQWPLTGKNILSLNARLLSKTFKTFMN